MNNQSIISLIQKCYEALGPKLEGLPQPFIMHPFCEFRYPVISLIFHPDRYVSKDDLEKLAQYFQKHPKKYETEPEQFYFNKLYPIEKSESKAIDQEYYTKLSLKRQTINCVNYFDRLVEKPKTKIDNLKVLYGDYFNTELHQKFCKATDKGFDRENDNKQSRIDLGVKKASNPKTVVLETNQGLPVASGAVFQKNEYAYLFAGSVLPEYRNKGIWKRLLFERQRLSQLNGAKHWIYSSSNDYIKHHSTQCFENVSHSKSDVQI